MDLICGFTQIFLFLYHILPKIHCVTRGDEDNGSGGKLAAVMRDEGDGWITLWDYSRCYTPLFLLPI